MGFVPKGIVVPVVTPLKPDGSFNEPVYKQLIEHLARAGVHGVFPFGTTGEFYAFDDDAYRHVLEVPAPTTSPPAARSPSRALRSRWASTR
jgi:4-hydroxy-tetrahydrodipicolinate synthase